jgi:hypothetical protein
MSSESSTSDALLKEILEGLKALRTENVQLAASVDKINGRVNMLAGIKQIKDEAARDAANGVLSKDKLKDTESEKTVEAVSQQYEQPPASVDAPPRRSSVSKISKIMLTSYPGQAGVDPLPMEWGSKDPALRGPVVVSRHPNTIRRRNGMYSPQILYTRLLLIFSSYWRPWRFILHLQRPRCRKQGPRHYPQARLHKHRTGGQDRTIPAMERQEEDRGYGPIRSPSPVVVQGDHGQGRR